MAATKTFTTQFAIGAKFTGQKGFADANKALDRTQRNAAAASRNIGGMFTALKVGLAGVAGYAGYKAFTKIFDIGQKALEAAKDVRKAHDVIRTTHAKTASLYPKRAMDIEKETQATIELAESMEKAGGIDAEAFGQALAKLRKHYSPAQIKAMAAGVQDWLVTMEGGAPTEEAAAERIDKINEFIRAGTKQGFAALNMTKEQAAAFNEYLETLKGVDREEARAQAVAKVLGKETGATAKWKKTDAGVTYDLAQAQEAWFETAGKGSAAAIPDLEKALTNLTVAMEPVAKLIDEQMTPHIKDLTIYLGENQEKFVTWGTNTVWALDYVFEHIERLKHVFWVFEYLIWLGEKFHNIMLAVTGQLAEPARLPQLPGAPSGVPNPALQEGEAGRRYREAQEKLKAAAESTKYPPYQIESQSLQQIKRAEATAVTGPNVGALKDVRARIAQELANDPKLQQLLIASVKAEVGDQPAATQQAYMESIMNRAAAEKKTLRAIITNPDYYPSATKSRLGKTFSANEQTRLEDMTKQVLGGSNIANYATGNESLNVRSGGAPIVSKPKGGYERFVIENWTKDWAARMKAAAIKAPTANLEAEAKSTYAPKETVQRAIAQKQEWTTNPWFRSKTEKPFWGEQPKPKELKYGAPPTAPQVGGPKVSMEDAMMRTPGGEGSKLRNVIKEMNIQQRTAGATGGQNIAMNAPITVNGVAPGRESLMAKKTALALRDPTAQLLTEIKKARAQENRLGYV